MEKVRLFVMHGKKQMGVFTLHETTARALLDGEVIIAEMGGFDPDMPGFCYGTIRVKP
jgi:hypothetical protein